MKRRVLAVVLIVCSGVWAQSPPSKSAPKAGSPQTGKTAQSAKQNELVGCLSQQGTKLVLMQPRQRRWYQLRGDQAQLQKNVGKMVRITGQLVLGQTSAFQVRGVQAIQDKCEMEATTSALPATGKTGARGDAETVTSTASVEQTTPGVQTERGVAENPSKGGQGTNPPARPTASQGAPPNPNVENPAEAQKIANAAQQAEL